jgi:hypothetical protein
MLDRPAWRRPTPSRQRCLGGAPSASRSIATRHIVRDANCSQTTQNQAVPIETEVLPCAGLSSSRIRLLGRTPGHRAWPCEPLKSGDLQGIRVSDGTRTRDHLDHNQELYQLSYAHRVAAPM